MKEKGNSDILLQEFLLGHFSLPLHENLAVFLTKIAGSGKSAWADPLLVLVQWFMQIMMV